MPSEDDFYGKMTYHWNKNGATSDKQLKLWLDPDNTGITKLQGMGDVKPELSTLYVFPNPTTGELIIKNGELRVENVEIFDVLGRKVQSSEFNVQSSETRNPKPETVLNIPHLQAGLYIMIITTDNGRKTHKIIKL
jgi:hypothetical protein